MSNLTCPECGSSNISTERRPDGFHHCMACKYSWKIGESQPKPSVFDRITASPEVLAEKLVYDWGHLCHNGDIKIYWESTILPDAVFGSKAEAIAATVARLKEVCND